MDLTMEFSCFSFSVDECWLLRTHTYKAKVNQSRKTFHGSFSTLKRDMSWFRWFSFHSWTKYHFPTIMFRINLFILLDCCRFFNTNRSFITRWSVAYGWLAVVFFPRLPSTTKNKINIIKTILGRWLIGTPQLHQSIRFYIKFIFYMAVTRSTHTHTPAHIMANKSNFRLNPDAPTFVLNHFLFSCSAESCLCCKHIMRLLPGRQRKKK